MGCENYGVTQLSESAQQGFSGWMFSITSERQKSCLLRVQIPQWWLPLINEHGLSAFAVQLVTAERCKI